MMDGFQYFLDALFQALLKSAPYVVVGYLVAAFIREGLPRNLLMRALGSKGIRPLFNAVGIGALLPICSCGTIPLGVGLVRSGAARGTTLSFMTSSPALSPVSILLGLKLLGMELTALYCGVVVLGSLVMGALGNRVLNNPAKASEKSGGRAHFEALEEPLPDRDSAKVPFSRRVGRALKWAFFDLGAEVSLDLLFGLALAALIVSMVPMEWIGSWLGGDGISSLLLVILLGIPVYTCSVPSIVVVASLLAMGASPGVAVAYLIAGPATNLGELTAIGRNMGWKTAVFYAVSLLAIALGGGLAANHFLGSGGFASFQTLEEGMFRYGGEIPRWHLPFGVLMIGVLGVGVWKKVGIFFTNPCLHCRFWKDVSEAVTCAGTCRVKKISNFVGSRKGAQVDDEIA